MKKSLLICLVLLAPLVRAQNHPACDSLKIQCCAFDSAGPNTITVYVSNYSSVLFDYPGFIIFNNAMDTMAMETVNYFGIGSGWQPHTLDVLSQISLPFSGFISLYTGFYDSLMCTFPFFIDDTVNTSVQRPGDNLFNLHPNPAQEHLIFQFAQSGIYTVMISDLFGRPVLTKDLTTKSERVDIQHLSPGTYVVSLRNRDGIWGLRKLLISR